MKVVILAGGYGTRLGEETELRPKPMIEIGNKPILWHIMKIYAAHGITDFIICLGYKGFIIKEYFSNYFLHNSDVTFDLRKNCMEVHHNHAESWRVTLIETGEKTKTGGRLKRVGAYLDPHEDFCFTYGDGVSDINLTELIAHHKKHGKLATVTSTQMPGRFGSLTIVDDQVVSFTEKPATEGSWISGGFFVLSPQVLDYIHDDETFWEREPAERLAAEGQMIAYFHKGFWHPMDTLYHKNQLEALWKTNQAPWKIWP